VLDHEERNSKDDVERVVLKKKKKKNEFNCTIIVEIRK